MLAATRASIRGSRSDAYPAGRLAAQGAVAWVTKEKGAQLASIGRRGWWRVKSSIADEVEHRVASSLGERLTGVDDHLAEAIARLQSATDRTEAGLTATATLLAELGREVSELKDTMAVQVDVENQTTALLGRLVQAATARLEQVEEILKDSLSEIGESPKPTGARIARLRESSPDIGSSAEPASVSRS